VFESGLVRQRTSGIYSNHEINEGREKKTKK
jgi:hypothetical protein